MSEKYFVMYERARSCESGSKNPGHRPTYHKLKTFSAEERASEFAMSKLSDQPILARQISSMKDIADAKIQADTYVLAIYFGCKYSIGSFDEFECEPIYEVERCTPSELEVAVGKIAKESPDKIYIGIERKLLS